MSVTFYHAPYSTAGITSAILSELDHGQSTPIAKRVELSLKAGDTRTPEYLANVNPNGLVPAIVHDGVAIWESVAITMYLGEVFGEKRGLFPALGPKRGEAMKWIAWANGTVVPKALVLMSAPKAEGDDGSPKDAALLDAEKLVFEAKSKQARENIAKHMGVLNKALEGREYLLKDGYTLADTHVWSIVSWLKMLGTTFDDVPNVKNWLAKVSARPGLASEVLNG